MVPYYFVAGRKNYACSAPIYALNCILLSDEVQSPYLLGEFSVRLKASIFNGIPSDMGTEQTIMKDSTGNGAIAGITRQKAALIRWILTCHITGEYAAAMKHFITTTHEK